jgi:hypothetical protein
MKLLPAIIFLVAALSVRAQTVANTSNVLHPLIKNIRDPNQRNAPSSLDQDPSMSADLRTAAPSRPAPLPAAQPAKPAEIIARIDAGLAVSQISLIGTVNGLKGRLYVTNIGSQEVIPLALFAVCNQKGFQIGSTAKTGQPLAPSDAEKIEVLATNLNAVDLKLMKLTAGSEKK